MNKKLIYQIINIFTAVLIGVCGVWKFVNEWFSFSHAAINTYYVAFAILFIILSFREIDVVEREMHFLSTFCGRGLIYLFIGLSLWTRTISFQMFASILIDAVALIYIVQYFKKAEPEFN